MDYIQMSNVLFENYWMDVFGFTNQDRYLIAYHAFLYIYFISHRREERGIVTLDSNNSTFITYPCNSFHLEVHK